MSEASATQAPAKRRGRPRPQGTISRDEAVFKALADAGGPVTREQLATSLDMQSSFIYLSLYRLREQGRVRRANRQWEIVQAA